MHSLDMLCRRVQPGPTPSGRMSCMNSPHSADEGQESKNYLIGLVLGLVVQRYAALAARPRNFGYPPAQLLYSIQIKP